MPSFLAGRRKVPTRRRRASDLLRRRSCPSHSWESPPATGTRGDIRCELNWVQHLQYSYHHVSCSRDSFRGNSGNYRRLCHTVGSGRLSSTQSPRATADTEAAVHTVRSYKETDITIHQ